MAELELDNTLRTILFSLQRCVALDLLSLQFAWWKENLLENKSTNPDPEENSQLRESKEGKIPLRQLIRINNGAFDKESLLKDHIFQEEMMMLEVRSISTFQE